MKKVLILISLGITSLFAQNKMNNYVNCEILPKDNRVMCNYHFDRSKSIKNVTFLWISPNGKIDRKKNSCCPKKT
jgi:hypothetical protein